MDNENKMNNDNIISETPSGGRLINVDVNREMRQSFLDYSMSVIVSRALPDVRDGLKPVHRRILYTMYENGLAPEKAYRKCADTVGSVLGRYHPHGDASVYDAMVRLAQDFSMRYMLVDGHGNFGSVDGDPPAAYRYTESRMSKISTEMLADIDKETVDFQPNFDDRLEEPTVLPSRFPNLLVNGSGGIAVGMTTNIPPHNLGETVDAMCMLIDNPDVEVAELMECMPGPDFPTGGIIMGRSGIRAAYATGKGKIIVRAKTEIVEAKNGRFKIIVTELPYQVNKARLISNIADLVNNKRIEGISNIEDHSDRSGMHIEIDVKRDASPQVVLNQLFTYTALQSTFGAILLAIVNGEPKTLTLKEILQHYIDFQVEVITRRTQFDLKKAQDRMHILEGLKIALDNIDEIIAIIKASKDTADAVNNLMERFGLTDIQAQAIVQMRLRQLTGLEREKIENEIAELKLKIADFIDILAKEERRLAIVKEANRLGAKVVGPNTIGVISPGKSKLGIMPDYIYGKGHIGIISRSGTLTHETASNLTFKGYGLSTCVGIGGDSIIGMNHADVIEQFANDDETDAIVIIGEIGGTSEEMAAAKIKELGLKKPVYAYIAGMYAPEGKKMGHAGAIVSGGMGTVKSKVAALEDAGVTVCPTLGKIVENIAEYNERTNGRLRSLEPQID